MHDLAMEVGTYDHMRKANNDRKVVLGLFDAKLRGLATQYSAMPSEFSWIERHYKLMIDYNAAVLTLSTPSTKQS